jgi:homoserine kinase
MKPTASAPGSAGNVGPGFDCLALAIELRCTVTAHPAPAWSVVSGGTAPSTDPDDLVIRAARAATDRPLLLEVESEIPRARGLGSSAAVAVAAYAAAARAAGREPTDAEIFEAVTRFEGHADNAAASVFGGLVAAAPGRYTHLPVHPDLVPVAGIPDFELPTIEARRALPEQVSLGSAARNLARTVFLVDGIRTGSAATLAGAAGDELHEDPRRRLSPVTAEMITAARDAGALHACWSGAGPTTLALVTRGLQDAVIEALRGVLGDGGTVAVLEVAAAGWR